MLSTAVESECEVYVAVLRARSDMRPLSLGSADSTGITSLPRHFEILLQEVTVANVSMKRLPVVLCAQSLIDAQKFVSSQLENAVDAHLRAILDLPIKSIRSVYLPLSQAEREQLTDATNVHLIVHSVERGGDIHAAALKSSGSTARLFNGSEANAARFYSFDFITDSVAALVSSGDGQIPIAASRDRLDSASLFRCERATRLLVRLVENWLHERAAEKGFLSLLFSPRCRSVSSVINNPAYSNLFNSETTEQHEAIQVSSIGSESTSRYIPRRVTSADIYNRLASADRSERVVSNPGLGDARLAEHVGRCDQFVANPRFASVVGLSYRDSDRFDTGRPSFGATAVQDESSLATVFNWLRDYATLDADMYVASDFDGDLSVSLSSSIRNIPSGLHANESFRSSATGRFEMLPIHVCDKLAVTQVPLYDGVDTTVAQIFNCLLDVLSIPRASAHLFALRLVEDPSDYHNSSATSSSSARCMMNGPSCEQTGGLQLKFYHRPMRLMQLWPTLRAFLFASLIEGDAQTDLLSTANSNEQPTPSVRVFFTRNQCATVGLEKSAVIDSTVSQLLFRDAVRHYQACFLYPFDRRELFVYAALLLRATGVQLDERRLRAHLTDEKLSYLFPVERLAAEPRHTETVQRLVGAYKEVSTVLRHHNEPSREAEYRFLELCRNLTFYGCSFFDADLLVPVSSQALDRSRSQSPVGSTAEQTQQQLRRVRVIIGVNDLGVHILRRHDKLLYSSFRYSTCHFLHDPAANVFAIDVFGRHAHLQVSMPVPETGSGDLSTASQSSSAWRSNTSSDCDTRPLAVIESRQACLIYYLICKLRTN